MTYQIRRVAVIGSGVMGSGIAAHLANVGIASILLDVIPKELTEAEKARGLTLEDPRVRNRIAELGKQSLLKQKPAALSATEHLERIDVGNLDDDLHKLADVDWIIEVVVEKVSIKKLVFEKIDQYRKKGTIVSSNTSGISIHSMAEGRSDDFKAHFLGTHFFNPPRYLKLLEIIPTAYTKQEVLHFIKRFSEDVLGKGVVQAKDTPNFIANRIGTYGLLITVQEMLKNGYSVGEVDSITGPALGRPKSATFRTLDLVGIDTFINVAKNVYNTLEGKEKKAFEVPEFMQEMHEKGWLGSKSGRGFFWKKPVNKKSEIFELNPKTLNYEPRKKLKTVSTEASKQAKTLPGKLKALVYADDRAGKLVWQILKSVLLYSAEKVEEIADDLQAVDNAMKWGFGWELGPFETWDAIGLEYSVNRMKEEGEAIPNWIWDMLASGYKHFYEQSGGKLQYYHQGTFRQMAENEKILSLPRLKNKDRVIKKNTGASLVDLGDGVALLEFHSQNNSIGPDVIQMMHYALDEVAKNYKGLVIGNQGKNFCVGANLMLILMEAQDANYFELDHMVRQFQQTMARVRYSPRPVVVAPFNMTLGGGTEIALPAAGLQASFETYMGLVEVGVGLIPGGGGNKELYSRLLHYGPRNVKPDFQQLAMQTFETIAMAKVTTSAHEAKDAGLLRCQDGISVNGDHLIYDAKQQVLSLYNKGYRPPFRKKIPVSGEAGFAAMLLGAQTLKFGKAISDHDLKVAKKLAYVIAGGEVPEGTFVDEQYLLDLEREAFLSLAGEPLSQQRMQHMLLKGKPLRN